MSGINEIDPNALYNSKECATITGLSVGTIRDERSKNHLGWMQGKCTSTKVRGKVTLGKILEMYMNGSRYKERKKERDDLDMQKIQEMEHKQIENVIQYPEFFDNNVDTVIIKKYIRTINIRNTPNRFK